MMATIDWTSPQIVGAIIAGIFALAAAVVGLFQRQKSKGKGEGQTQSSILSSHVQQFQAKGDISIRAQAPPNKPSAKRSPKK